MHLKNDAGDEFELRVAGYQFPDLEGLHDANWLNITINVAMSEKGSWTATDPCLETWELQELIEWFEAIRSDQPTKNEITFIEPNLHCKLVGDNVKSVQIFFELELRPEWARQRVSGSDLWVEFELTPENLDEIISSLTADLARFPIRK